MFDIEHELKRLPTTPGVYMHKDNLGCIIYVGKAVNLRNRVRQYFHRSGKGDPKLLSMVSNIESFEYIKCATEVEALVLESNLIKKYKPKYNILLKDDKTYPYIKITTKEEFPRIYKTRRLVNDGNRYFGPYTDVDAVRNILKMIDEIYPLKKCRTTSFPKNFRPCLNYYIGKCSGMCIGNVNRQEYRDMIDNIIDLLSGHDKAVIKIIEGKMNEASSEMRYEDAAKYRDYAKALKKIGDVQRASVLSSRDADVIIPIVKGVNSAVVKYSFREGKLIGREISDVKNVLSYDKKLDGKTMIDAFIKQHYVDKCNLPKEVLLPYHLDDETLLEEFFENINHESVDGNSSKERQARTRIIVPLRGEKKDILKMAISDSIELSDSIDLRLQMERQTRSSLNEELSALIKKAKEILSDNIDSVSSYSRNVHEFEKLDEYRIEAYDISNFNGLDTVGAMVVYEGYKPIKSDYRKFRIRTAEGDDYGSLREVIYRRLKRAKSGDSGFSIYPDLMFIDGGLGQVHAVGEIVDAFRIEIPVVGLEKDDFHKTRAIVFSDGSKINLEDNKLLWNYCSKIQNEVHRFAITYMSGVKGKNTVKSALEEIDGVGPARRRMLLEKFGTIADIKSASYEELIKTPGMNSKVAENIINYFKTIER